MSEQNRWERLFLYLGDEKPMFGIQSIRYDPSRDKNVYGAIKTRLVYPTQRSIDNKYPLSMWPKFICLPQEIMVTGSYEKLKDNIEPKDVAMQRLFVECNKQTSLIISAVTGKRASGFQWNKLFVGKPVEPAKDETVKTFDFGGPDVHRVVITSDIEHSKYFLMNFGSLSSNYDIPIRKGDRVDFVGVTEHEGDAYAIVAYGDSVKFKWGEFIRRLVIKFTNKKLYRMRYADLELGTSIWLIPFKSIKVVSNPVERPQDDTGGGNNG